MGVTKGRTKLSPTDKFGDNALDFGAKNYNRLTRGRQLLILVVLKTTLGLIANTVSRFQLKKICSVYSKIRLLHLPLASALTIGLSPLTEKSLFLYL